MNKVFNRNAPEVVQAAASLSQEKFVQKFRSQTSEIALQRIYLALRSQLSRKKIDEMMRRKIDERVPIVTSGEPIEVTQTIVKEIIKESQEVPKSIDRIEDIEKLIDHLVDIEAEQEKQPIKIKKTATPKKKIEKKEAPIGSKRERIISLLIENPDYRNRDIKKILKEEGFSIYDSEILSARKKINE